MANTDSARGFWPVKHLTGGLIRANKHTIATGFATNIFKGDVVKLVAAGGIEDADAGDRVLGIFNGVEYTDASGNVVFKKYWPASTTATNIKAYVYDDPNIVFAVQQATGGSVATTDVGLLGDHVAGTGSTTTGQSAHELSGTITTGAAGFRVLGLWDAPGNAYGEHANLLVQVFEHELAEHGQGTPGV
jgi:hypothetical protein|tara:strand:- start:5992 stop:6558 length:567 start_codon:yes stop_codon:yes gene_type:complete